MTEADNSILSIESPKKTKKPTTIQVVARVRPCFDTSMDSPDLQPDELNENGIRIGQVSYGFNKMFWKDSTQDQIFKQVAQPLIDHALEGYNATLFAYGQTGSGKTYTLSTGETYKERGVIPRTIEYLFNKLKGGSNYEMSIHVSYIEIYNESIVVDLLSESKSNGGPFMSALESVSINDTDHGIELLHSTPTPGGRSAPIYPCASHEDAFNFLINGETNRRIASTDANNVSSRSHCIFSFYISGRNVNDNTIKSSKMHIVDLAGSEKYDNVSSEERQKETKSINLSIFYLHTVIDALQTNSDFVPYRNSKMTLLLKDSLGGNCMTTMIATLSSVKSSIPETIETCKFAQRVMTIKNSARANVAIDMESLVAKLRAEVLRLRRELAVARGEVDEEPVSPEEAERLKENVKKFIAGTDELQPMSISRVTFVLDYFLRKNAFSMKNEDGRTEEKQNPKAEKMDNDDLQKTIKVLEHKLQLRNNEITILVNMNNQRKNRLNAYSQTNLEGGESGGSGLDGVQITLPKVDKQLAFKEFAERHPKKSILDQNQLIIKDKMMIVKKLSQELPQAKQTVQELNKQLVEMAKDDNAENDPKFIRLKQDLISANKGFIDMRQEMEQLKKEIMEIDLLKKGIIKQMKAEFAKSWREMYGNDSSINSQTNTIASNLNETPNSSISHNHSSSSVSSVLTEKNDKVQKPIIKSTGDPKADEAIKRFEEVKAQLLKQKDEENMRKLSARSSAAKN